MGIATGSPEQQQVALMTALPAGGNTIGSVKVTDGTNTSSVKAASTAAVATDPALVVAVSPNNSVAVTGTFWQATQPVSIATTLVVSGPLTDAQLRAAAVPVSGTFWQATQPVSGTFWPATQPVSGTFWQATQPISAASLPLPSGAATAAKQPALGTAGSAASDVITVQGVASMTALKVDGSAVTQPVSGTFWQATQPVSGPLTDTQLRASAVPVSQSGTWTVQPGNTPNTTAWLATLANSTGKTNVLKTGSLASSATTADQVILTYTVTTGKTFYLQYIDFCVRLTTFAATATNFGNVSVENPSGTKIYTQIAAGTGVLTAPIWIEFPEPIPIAATTVIRVVCTPSASTAMTWQANFGGFEK